MQTINDLFSPTVINRQRVDLQRLLYRELIRITTMLDDSVDEPQLYALMAKLVKQAKYYVNGETVTERVQQLIDFIYKEHGFQCRTDTKLLYEDVLLHRVLRRKYGTPETLGAILLYVASVLELPMYPVNFPSHLLVRANLVEVGKRQHIRYINPIDGSDISFEQMMKLVEGEMGYECGLERMFLDAGKPQGLILRLEHMFRKALLAEDKVAEALKLLEYRLVYDPEDPEEIRERGMLYARLECFKAACEDFRYFIEQCPDDPMALFLQFEMHRFERASEASVLH